MKPEPDDFSDVFSTAMAIMAKREASITAEQLAAEQDRIAAADAAQRRRVEARREAALDGLTPPRFHWAHADAPELQARVAIPGAALWARRPPGTAFVLLLGGSGYGKTSLACAALRTAVVEGRASVSDCLFMPAHRLGLARIQAKAGTGEPETVQRAMTVDWLLLDDLGSERDTVNNAIPDVIFERHNRMAITWVTTGLSRKQLEDRYGAGILRRLVDGATRVRLGPTTPVTHAAGLPLSAPPADAAGPVRE